MALTGCVLLGQNTGGTNLTDNRLMIHNSNVTDPLLDGSFTSRTVQLNGTATLGQTGNTTNVHAVNGDIETTIGAAGAAAALPATPEGYLRVSVNGTVRRIPFYLEP